jgi:hypothetical protein
VKFSCLSTICEYIGCACMNNCNNSMVTCIQYEIRELKVKLNNRLLINNNGLIVNEI